MAGAFVTRALVLGVVRLFEPINGYQVTRELLSWRVEDWARLKPGSVYSMLGTLAKQQLILRHDLEDGSRTVAVYETTEEGRAYNIKLKLLDLAEAGRAADAVINVVNTKRPGKPGRQRALQEQCREQAREEMQQELRASLLAASCVSNILARYPHSGSLSSVLKRETETHSLLCRLPNRALERSLLPRRSTD